MAGENLTRSDRLLGGWVGSPLGERFHFLAGSGYPPAEEVETIETKFEGEKDDDDRSPPADHCVTIPKI